MSAAPFRIAALYRFAPILDREAVQTTLKALCEPDVRGILLVAHEGLNGTIAGPMEAVDRVLAGIRALPGFGEIEVKFAETEAQPFHRMKVRLKAEIVTMGQPDIDPLSGVGHYVAPEDWNALISDPDTILIDTRNDYEVAIGTFAGAIDPKTASFREFPGWFRAQREALLAKGAQPRVAMFCTGGIRCEKSTAFLKSEGIDEVYHLHGGILKYLETIPPEQSTWQGECFVFDERVAVGHGLAPGSFALCRACRRPVSPADRQSPLYVEGTSCPACHGERSDAQRAGYAERHRQAAIAAARGKTHIGTLPEAD